MIRRHPFVGKLLALAGAAMLPLLLLFGYAAWRTSDEAQRGAAGAVRMRASLLAQQTAATLGRAENLLGFLARRPELITLDAPQCGALLASMAAVDPQWSNVAVTTLSGELVCATVSAPTPPGTSVAAEPWFAPAMAADGFLVSQPTIGRVSARPAVVLSLPLRTLDGRPIGLIGVSLDLARFTAEWEHASLPPGSLLALHNGKGTLVVRVPPVDAAAHAGIEAELAAFRRDRPDGAGVSIGADGVERVMAVTGVPGRSWVAVAGIPSAQVYAPGRAALSRSLLGVTLAALLAGALALAIARRLAAPLNALARTARAVAEGERGARADEHCPGEFRDVAVEFNRMLDARDRAESAGRESQRRLQEMLDHAELLAAVADTDGRVTYANDCLLRVTGWTREELIGRDWILTVLPPERAPEREALLTALKRDRFPRHSDGEIVTRSGERRIIRWNTTSLRSPSGEVIGGASLGEDITVQRDAERRAARTASFYAALSRTNQAIVREPDMKALFNEVCHACVESGHATIATIWLGDGGWFEMSAWAGPAERLFGAVPARFNLADPAHANTVSAFAMRDGKPAISNDYLHDFRGRYWSAHAEAVGIRAVAVFPLRRGGQLVGTFTLYVDEVGFFDEQLTALLEEMASDLSFALDNADREAARVAAQRDAQAGYERFRRVFNATPASATVTALDDQRVIEVNDATCRGFGFTREEILGHTWAELGVGMSAADRATFYALNVQHGSVQNHEATVRVRSGEWREVLVNSERIEFAGRECLLTLATDITERKRMERDLRRSLERFQLAASTGNVWHWDEGVGTTSFLPQLKGVLGYPIDDGVGAEQLDDWRRFLPAEAYATLRAALVDHFKHHRPFDVEVPAIGAGGAERWLHLRGQAVWNEQGRAVRMAGTVFDITERRSAQRALHESQLRLSGIVETAMDAIITVDRQQRIVVFNHAATQMFRLPAHEAIGSSIERFIPTVLRANHGEHVRNFANGDAKALRMGSNLELNGLRADGEEFPIEASISKLGEGERLLMTVVIRDASERRAAEQARAGQIAAEAASRAKNDFLSRMSHELRTPLNAMLGFTQLLESDPRSPLSERQRQHVELVRQAGWHLMALIDDVLDVSRIEAGQLQVDLRPVPLTELLDSTLRLCETQAQRHGVTLQPAYREQPLVIASSDPVRLRQVMLNLLSNAIKYNRRGGQVRVSASHQGGQVQVDVVDNGLGMTTAQLARLFEPFNRLGREHGDVEGTGIGLALTRELVHLMHGRIEVDSDPGRGTQVRLILPAPPASAPADAGTEPALLASDAAGDPGPQGVVLYIEDNAVNLLLVEQFLSRWPGVRFEQAEDGQRGIDAARALRPDLVLLDMQLPDMDGHQVLRALRDDPVTARSRVVVLSASAMPEEVARIRRAGATDYWTKPLDFERFMADMRRLLDER